MKRNKLERTRFRLWKTIENNNDSRMQTLCLLRCCRNENKFADAFQPFQCDTLMQIYLRANVENAASHRGHKKL